MKRNIALEVSRVTEAAALASYPWIGKGKKEFADKAAVDAMRHVLSTIDITGEVVIGEGEIDEAPMLYIGEKIGTGTENVEIAVDPIDGTRMVALGQENAVAVIVIAEPNVLFKAPDMYMEKLMVSREAKGSIDIDDSLTENVKRVASVLKKDLSDMKVMTLAKPRHEKVIKELQELGVSVIAVPDGDVACSILVAMPNEEIDVFYGIGGAPEGVISAAIIKSLDGDMQARLILRNECKDDNLENQNIAKIENERCEKLGLQVGSKITINELCKNENIIMSITGITNGTLLDGVKVSNGIATTQTLMIRGKTRTIRTITSEHFLDKKDKKLIEIMKRK